MYVVYIGYNVRYEYNGNCVKCTVVVVVCGVQYIVGEWCGWGSCGGDWSDEINWVRCGERKAERET